MTTALRFNVSLLVTNVPLPVGICHLIYVYEVLLSDRRTSTASILAQRMNSLHSEGYEGRQ